MAFITLRQGNSLPSANATIKGSPLSNEEVDNNFANLNISKLEVDSSNNIIVNNITLSSILSSSGNVSIMTTTSNVATFTGNSYIILPNGNVDQRGSANIAGSIRYNSEDQTFEGYTLDWGPIAGGLESTANVTIFSLGVGTPSSNVGGEIRATGTITAHYSDERLKDIEGVIDNAVEKVLSINGYYFKENATAKALGYADDNRQVGVSAQEVLAVLPEVVKPAPIDSQYYAVQYEKIVPLLIQAIKELHQEIQQLKQNSHQH